MRPLVLTWDDACAIREANKAGVGTVVLAERYDVCPTTIGNVIAGVLFPDPEYVAGVDRVCVECGETFRTTHTAKRFCSLAHQRAWNSRRTARRSRGQALDGSETRPYPRRAR